MKLKPVIGTIMFSIILLIGSGCAANDNGADSAILSPAEIENIARNKLDNSPNGEIKITEIKLLSNGHYQVKWKRPQNCESGTAHFDQKTGESVGLSEYTVC